MGIQLRRKRKAQLSIQFNWIFVIIAGAFILLFFLTIVYRNMGGSEVRVSRKVVDQLVAIFAGSEVATSTAQEIQMPDITINLLCEQEGISEFNIEGTGINHQTPIGVVFSPGVISGKKMTNWALDWSIPFRVTNFLYLTSPKVRYYFIGKDPFDLMEDLPDEDKITREFLPDIPEAIDDKNNDEVRFILFGTTPDPALAENLKNQPEEISAVSFSRDMATFYSYNGEDFEEDGMTEFLTKAEIYGIVFSSSYDSYACNMQKAFRRLEQVTRVYGGRAKQLNTAACNYRSAEELLYQESRANPRPNSMEYQAKRCYLDFSSCQFSQLKTIMERLSAKNRQLEYASCPMLY